MGEVKSYNLRAFCSNCGNDWNPFKVQMIPPLSAKVTCPKCIVTMENYTWEDPEIRKEKARQKLGLIQSDDIINEIKKLNDEIELLKSKLDLEQSKNKVLNNRLEQIENWKNVREEDFLDIDRIAKDMREDEKFRKYNK